MELTHERKKCLERYFDYVLVRRQVYIEFANFPDRRESFANVDSCGDKGEMDSKS